MRDIRNQYLKVCKELEEYHKMEKILSEHYGCNLNLIEFAESWIKAMIAREKGDKHYRFCVLSNEDYDEWKEYKRLKEKRP